MIQVKVALQLLAGCCADGAVLVEPGEFGVLRADEVAAQFPFGQATWLRRRSTVGAGAAVPDAGLQADADPVDHGVWDGLAVGELVEPGQRLQGEPLHDERDHDDRGDQHQGEVTFWQGSTAGCRQGMDRAAASGTTPRVPAQDTMAGTAQDASSSRRTRPPVRSPRR